MPPVKRKRSSSPVSSSLLSGKITKETVQSKVTSLLRWRESLPPSLIQEDDSFYLVLYLTQIPPPQSHNIPLPHSLLPKIPKLCLIMDDNHSNSEEDPIFDEAMEKIDSDNIPISMTLNLTEFKRDYREVCDSYDLFFGEKSVISQLSGLIGDKMAVELDLERMDWKSQIEEACSSTLLCLSGGNCHVVRVAKVLMDKDEIVANVIAAIEWIVIALDSWKYIEYFQLKLLGSHALPIYQRIPGELADRFEPETVESTVNKLNEWRDSKLSDKGHDFFYVVLYLYASPNPDGDETHKILLPHSFLPHHTCFPESPLQLCLIVDDKHDRGFSKNDALKKIESDNVLVSGVMELSDLRSDYHSTEKRKELCDSYDLFLAEESVIPLLAGELEDKFAMPLDLKDSDWKGQVEKACCSTLLCLSKGTYYEVRVANAWMKVDEIVDNVVAAINGIVNVLPSQWGSISSLHLKLLESLSLPIYQPKEL